MDYIAQLRDLIHEQFDVDPATIEPDAPFADYNLDSLTVAELMFAVEDKFAVEVPDESVRELTTLRGLADLLERLVGAKKAPA
jgi:acyl carrier protein